MNFKSEMGSIEIEQKFTYDLNVQTRLQEMGALYKGSLNLYDVYYDTENFVLCLADMCVF